VQPLIVAFAGIDGAGKTTQAERLCEWLRARGAAVTLERNESLRVLRETLDDIARDHGTADLFELLGADRARLALAMPKWQTFHRLFAAPERLGEVLVFDRYVHCQQAHARLRRVSDIWLHDQLFSCFPRPDVTIFLELDPAVATARVRRRGGEQETEQELTALQDAYRALPDAWRFLRVDAGRPVDEVAATVRTFVSRRLAPTSATTAPAPTVEEA
jgi:dTMP kinase